MKTFLLLISLLFNQAPRVAWFDDFIGIGIQPAYSISLAGAGRVYMAPDSGGAGGLVLLTAPGDALGVARLRLGEDPGTGPFNALNFNARKNLIYETRVYLNRNTDVQVTIGFVGLKDPEHVLAALYASEPGDGPATWGFQVANTPVKVKQFAVDFCHTPGNWFTVRIEAGMSGARLFINGQLLGEVEEEFIPSSGICPEFQLWNRRLDVGYSQPTMWIDYLSVSQDR